MNKDTISRLPDMLRNHICPIEKTSFDESHDEHMCNSKISVINFDKIPREYARNRNWSSVPNSNDALYITAQNEWYFIEFKNGSIEKASIYRKIYDSILILMDLGIIPSMDFVRSNVQYILVYNEDKYTKSPRTDGLRRNYDFIMNRADREERLFEIEKFQGYLFSQTHTYFRQLFTQSVALRLRVSPHKNLRKDP